MIVEVGSGSYSRVYRIKTKEGTEEACKAISNRCFSVAEAYLMRVLSHPHLMRANWISSNLDYIASEHRAEFYRKIEEKIQTESCCPIKFTPEFLDHVFIFMDEMKGTLENESLVRKYDTKENRFGLISGLKYFHDQGFVHNDLKTSNILVGKDGKFIISDFSCCDQTGTFSILFRGTCNSRAPEFFFNPELPSNPKFDVWSMGLILLYLETGMKVDHNLNQNHVHRFKEDVLTNPKYRILKGKKITLPPQSIKSGMTTRTLFPYGQDDISALIFIMDELYYESDRQRNLMKVKDPILRDLIGGMLQPDPEKRSSLDNVLNHEYFNSLPNILGEPSPKAQKTNHSFSTGLGMKVDEIANIVKTRLAEKNPKMPLSMIIDAAKSTAINFCFRNGTYFSQGRITRSDLLLLDSIGYYVC